MGEVPLLDIGLSIELEDDAVTELFLIGTQRADEVTEAFREHGDGTVDEVDTRGTVVGLLVDGRTFLHIVRDIGDMHAHLPKTAIQLADGEGIVEVLGILGVDGTGEDIAEVLTAGNLFRRDTWLYLLGSLFDMLRIAVWQTILRQDGMHLHIVVALLAQYVNDLTNEILRLLRRPLRNLDDSLVARLATLQLLLGNKDVVYEDVAFSHQESIVFLDLQLADSLVALMGENLYDHSLFDMLLAASHIGYLHTVTIHSKQRVALADEDRCTAIIRLEGVLTVGLTDKGSLLHLRLLVQTI